MKFPSYTILQAEGLAKYPNVTKSMFSSDSTEVLKSTLQGLRFVISSNDKSIWYAYNRFMDNPSAKAEKEYNETKDGIYENSLKCAACQWHIEQILKEREAVNK